MFRSPQVVLFSTDGPRAAACYATLGFTEVFRVPSRGEPIHVDLQPDGHPVQLVQDLPGSG